MALTIDYGLNGAESFVSKTAKMAGSVKALDGAWKKYGKTMDSIRSASAIKSLGSGGGGGGAGGIIQNAAIFYSVGKIMERLMTDRMKSWFASLVKSDVEKYKAIGRGIGRLINPMTRSIAANTSLMYDSFKLSAGVLKTQMKDMVANTKVSIGRLGKRGTLFARAAGIKLLGRGPAMKVGAALSSMSMKKLPAGLRLAAIEAAMYTRVAGNLITKVIPKLVPFSLLIAAPLVMAMLDSRIQAWLERKIQMVVDALSKAITYVAKGTEFIWTKFTDTLARTFNNPYYTGSKFNQEAARKAQTPGQQSDFMASHKRQLEQDDMEELVKVEMARMKVFFDKENAKRAKEIEHVQDMMIKQGRL